MRVLENLLIAPPPATEIAQLVIQRVELAAFREVDELPESVRGTGGFGSSGGHRASEVVGSAAPGDDTTGTVGSDDPATD